MIAERRRECEASSRAVPGGGGSLDYARTVQHRMRRCVRLPLSCRSYKPAAATPRIYAHALCVYACGEIRGPTLGLQSLHCTALMSVYGALGTTTKVARKGASNCRLRRTVCAKPLSAARGRRLRLHGDGAIQRLRKARSCVLYRYRRKTKT